jgi:hypothetical protein
MENRDLYVTYQEIYGMNTRYNTNFNFSTANLIVFQRGPYFFGIKLFNHLPISTKSLSNETELFKPALKIFLPLHSFYSIEEYFNYNSI